MNELLFLCQSFFLTGIVFLAARFGKEALIALSCTLWLLANLFVTKQITLFGLDITASDAYALSASLATVFIAKWYGKKEATKAIFIGFALLVLFAVASWLHLHLQANAHDTTQPHFHAILSSTPRIVFASLVAYLISQLLLVVLARFTLVALIVSMFLDTILFGTIGLFGIVASLPSVLFVGLLTKFFILLLATPAALLCKKYVRIPL